MAETFRWKNKKELKAKIRQWHSDPIVQAYHNEISKVLANAEIGMTVRVRPHFTSKIELDDNSETKLNTLLAALEEHREKNYPEFKGYGGLD